MPTNAEPTTLSASALEAFLDETEQALEQQCDSELAPRLMQDSLRSALQRQQYRADTLASVRRLAQLWSRAGAPDAALRVLDEDGAAVLAAVPGQEYDETRLALALCRVEVLGDNPARGLTAAAEAAYDLLRGLGQHAQSQNAWNYLGSLASSAGLHELERRCADGRHAFQRAQADRQSCRASDKAYTALWCAHSYTREGLAQQARAAAADAVQAFQEAGPDQDLDLDDWLRLGERLPTLMPETMDTIVERVHALTPATAAQPQRREIAVRLARLQARALYSQGALLQALETAHAGRFALTDDDHDGFSAQVLDWLVEAGQVDAAGALAFECAFNERDVSADHACRIALAQLAGGARSGYWPLVLAWASTVEDTAWVVGQEDPARFFERHLALARSAGAPAQAIDAVQGLYLFDAAQAQAQATGTSNYAAALPLLESAARDPALATPKTVPNIWLCRMHLHGVERALEMPFVDVACAGWCYNIGVMLNDMCEELPPDTAWPEHAVAALAARYYARGAAQFEQFFATGQGMYRDGDRHVYSMLCNNLAIHYRFEQSDYQAALALHRKGIEASSFAEHYDGVMYCLLALKDEPGFVEAADQLWHYAADHGYSRHKPAPYIDEVARCLSRLDRDREIPIWLQRLDEWWDCLDESDKEAHAGSYWQALSVTLYCMAPNYQADTLVRLEAALPDLCGAGLPFATRLAANMLRNAGQRERALALYQQALSQIDPDDPFHVEEGGRASDDLEECKRQIRAERPWWKFWG